MDATKNAINNQKKHQVPEKSEEQLKQEAFMKAPPSRAEMAEYVQNAYSQITNSFNIVFSVLQKALVDKGLITVEELEQAGQEAMEKLNIKDDEDEEEVIETSTEEEKEE